MKIISLNGHATTILRSDCPVVNQSVGGRDSLFLNCSIEEAEEYVLLRLAKTTLPIPKVAPAALPAEELVEIEGATGPIKVKVQPTGQGIENLPEPQEGVVYLTGYVTAKAARELGRTDFWSSGPSVMLLSPDGNTTTIFGCLGVNRFE